MKGFRLRVLRRCQVWWGNPSARIWNCIRHQMLSIHHPSQLLSRNIAVRAGSVAVAGHALDCAECAGMRRMRWNAPNALECADCDGMRWKAPIAPNCANLRRLCQLRRLAPFAPIASFAPNCAVCAELRRLRWNCAGILPTAWHRANATLWLSQPGAQLAAVKEINNAGQTLNDCYCLPFSCFFWRKTTNLASIDVLLCAHPEFCAHFGTVLGLLNIIHISHMRIDLMGAILFLF